MRSQKRQHRSNHKPLKQQNKPLKRKLHLKEGVWSYQIHKTGVRFREPEGSETYFVSDLQFEDCFNSDPILFYYWKDRKLIATKETFLPLVGLSPRLLKRYVEVVFLQQKEWNLRKERKSIYDQLKIEFMLKNNINEFQVTDCYTYLVYQDTLEIRRLLSSLTKEGKYIKLSILDEAFNSLPCLGTSLRIPTHSENEFIKQRKLLIETVSQTDKGTLEAFFLSIKDPSGKKVTSLKEGEDSVLITSNHFISLKSKLREGEDKNITSKEDFYFLVPKGKRV